jgi:hypothetical protein
MNIMNVSRYLWRYRRLKQQYRNLRVLKLCNTLLERTDFTVYAGPFAGMKLVKGTHLSLQPAMIVGSYEAELHHAIYKAISTAPDYVINIGSAHGYYATGLARHLPNTTVIAFEPESEENWDEALRLAEANGVTDKIIQKGLCTVTELRESCRPDSFVLCDCEGDEMTLLNPEAIPSLQSCYIICELHDFIVPGLTGELVRRFKKSHINQIHSEKARNPGEYRVLDGLSSALQHIAVEETRCTGRMITIGRYMELIPKPGNSHIWNT